MARFKVFQQLRPVQDKRTQNWFPVLYPRGEVLAADSHQALLAAKKVFHLPHPIVQKSYHATR